MVMCVNVIREKIALICVCRQSSRAPKSLKVYSVAGCMLFGSVVASVEEGSAGGGT
jgi:hypothetical protein